MLSSALGKEWFLMKALGMIEVYGYLAAVEALDSALKAANVELVRVEKVRGGLVSVLVTGDVGSTKAAIDAAAAAAERVGTVVSVHVIPRPSDDIERMLGGASTPPPADESKTAPSAGEPEQEPVEESVVGPVKEPAPKAVKVPAPKPEKKSEPVDKKSLSAEKLQAMTVQELRMLARELEMPDMSKADIRYSKKNELISKITEFVGQE